MKPLILPSLLLISIAGAASAADYQWDVNGVAANLGGTGTWNTTNTFWDDLATGTNTGTDTTVAVSSWTTSDNATFGGSGGTVTLGGTFSLGRLNVSGANYSFTGANTITVNANSTWNNEVNLINGAKLEIKNGAVISAGTAGFHRIGQSGIGTVELSGTGSGYTTQTGVTIFGQGTLTVGAGTSYSLTGTSGSSLLVGQGKTAADTATLNVSGTLTYNNTGAFVIANGNSNGIVNLNSGGVIETSRSITKVGAGAANLNFNGGTLRVTNALATTIGNVVMTMNAGATFDIGSSITFSTGANALLAGTGAQVLTKTGAGTLTIPGAAAYTGATDIRDGALQLTGSLSSSTTLNLGNGTTSGKLILGNSGAANSATIAGLTTTGTGTANAIVGGGNASVSTLTVNLASGTNTFAGRIGGTGTNENAIALTKTGNGTLTLSATNTYTGATNVNLGKLQIGAGGTTGSIASGSAVSIASGATAEWFSSSTGVAVSNGISGSGTLSFLGTGIIGQSEYSGLSGASTFTGAVSVDKARLQITAANQLSSASGISVLNGGQLFLNTTTNDFDTTTYTYDRNLTMTGNGWNETGGPFGALRMRGVTLSGNVSLTGNSRIETFGPSDSFVSTISGEISGDFGITTAGNRTLTLSADNIYTGPTTVSSGKLVINGSTSTGLVTVNSGATLGGTGTVGGAATINGALAPGNSIGTLNFSQTLTLAGTSDFEIDPTLGLGLNRASDLANVFGAITYGGILNVLYGGANTNFTNGMVFNLFDGASFSGTFSTLNLPDLTGTGLSWQNNLATNGTLTVVPEPAAALLGGIGLVVLLRRRRS